MNMNTLYITRGVFVINYTPNKPISKTYVVYLGKVPLKQRLLVFCHGPHHDVVLGHDGV